MKELLNSYGNNKPRPLVQMGHSMITRSQHDTIKPKPKYFSSDYRYFADAIQTDSKIVKFALDHLGLPATTKDFAKPTSVRQTLTFSNWALAMRKELML